MTSQKKATAGDPAQCEGDDGAALALFGQASLEALPVPIAILDEEGGILATNRSWRKFADDVLSCCQQGQAGTILRLARGSRCRGCGGLRALDHSRREGDR